MNQDNLKTAQVVHHRFEFYLVALTFTIAGFAIQTGKFSGNVFGDFSEIISWAMLCSSGAIGLWRIQYFPGMYRVHDHLEITRQDIERLKGDKSSRGMVQKLEHQVEEGTPTLEKIEVGNRNKYLWQRGLFISGLVALVLARFIVQMQEHYW